jgi:serine/threonine protein kinase
LYESIILIKETCDGRGENSALKIIRKLGEGGIVIVYLAEDTKLTRKVAAKGINAVFFIKITANTCKNFCEVTRFLFLRKILG